MISYQVSVTSYCSTTDHRLLITWAVGEAYFSDNLVNAFAEWSTRAHNEKNQQLFFRASHGYRVVGYDPEERF